MSGTATRLRFGVFLALAVLAGVQVADLVAGAPPGAPRPGVALVGFVGVTSYEIHGVGGAVPGIALGRTLACAPCAVTAWVVDSDLAVVGNGEFGILPPGRAYTVAGYVGEVSTARTAQGAFLLQFAGTAEAVRGVPEGWE